MHAPFPLCVVFYQNVILCNFFVINFFPTSEDSEKNSSPDQKFAVEKPLISNGTLRTNCTYAKWTNIYGHQKSNIFSNDASRCCFESSNGREGNCVLSRGFIIPSVREFFSCVIIFAKSCLMAALYLYLLMDRWSPGIKVIIYSKGINHALITSTRDGQLHWESLHYSALFKWCFISLWTKQLNNHDMWSQLVRKW